MLSWVYASDDAIPIAVGDPSYYAGLPLGKVEKKSPTRASAATPYWLSTSAAPAGLQNLTDGKISPGRVPFGFGVVPVDAVPFYLGMGTSAVDAGDGDYDITLSTSGAVPDLIIHRENNLLGATQAKEYGRSFCTKLGVRSMNGLLACDLEFLAEREQAAVQLTNVPVLRGNSLASATAASTRGPFRIRGNSGLTCVWNSKALGAYVNDISFTIENAYMHYDLEDGNDYGTLVCHGRHSVSDVHLDLVLPGSATDIDSLAALVDDSTSSSIVLTIPRRHANDKLTITLATARLKSFDVAPAPSGSTDDRVATAVFHGISTITVNERQVTAAAASDINAAADYEL